MTPKQDKQKTPRTAWELCESVARAIQRIPRTYLQALTRTPARQKVEYYGMSKTTRHEPYCGAAYCIAGHIVLQVDGVTRTELGGLMLRANEILGLSDDATFSLFAADAVQFDGSKPGTHAYARAGAAHLRAWMVQHADHLKACVLDTP